MFKPGKLLYLKIEFSHESTYPQSLHDKLCEKLFPSALRELSSLLWFNYNQMMSHWYLVSKLPWFSENPHDYLGGFKYCFPFTPIWRRFQFLTKQFSDGVISTTTDLSFRKKLPFSSAIGPSNGRLVIRSEPAHLPSSRIVLWPQPSWHQRLLAEFLPGPGRLRFSVFDSAGSRPNVSSVNDVNSILVRVP